MFLCHLFIFFGEVSIKVFGSFVNQAFIFLLLSFKSSLHILNNIPFSDMCFANVSSQSLTYLSILLTLSFQEQKFVIILKFSLSIISIMDHVLSVLFKKASSNPLTVIFRAALDSQENWEESTEKSHMPPPLHRHSLLHFQYLQFVTVNEPKL